jgi:hypothetical protein
VFLTKEQLRSSARPMLRAALSKFLQTATRGFVDRIVKHILHPAGKSSTLYGATRFDYCQSMIGCNRVILLEDL